MIAQKPPIAYISVRHEWITENKPRFKSWLQHTPRITFKNRYPTRDNVPSNGRPNVGYVLSDTYGTEAGKKRRLASVKDANYRTEATPGGNLTYNYLLK